MEQPSDQRAVARALRELTVVLTRISPRSDLSRTAAGTLARLLADGPQRITDLATQEAASQPAMTGLIQRLEQAGFVERQRDPDDGRASRIAITATGEAAVERRRTDIDAMLLDLISRLDPDHLSALREAVPALEELSHVTEDHAHA